MGSEIAPREDHHQSLSAFVASTGRNTTGVELGPNARTVLWAALGVVVMPYILKLSLTLYDDGGLWFGDGLVLRWARTATSKPVLAISMILFFIIAATLYASRVGTPTTPHLTASALAVVGAGPIAIPVGIVVVVLLANLIAALVAAALILWLIGFAISSWLDD